MSASDTTAYQPMNGPASRGYRPSRLSLFLLASGIVLCVWMLTVAFPPSFIDVRLGGSSNHTTSEHRLSTNATVHAGNQASSGDVQKTQIVIRTTPPNGAGLGSVVAQLRSSAALATMLDASLATFGITSDHITGYRAASIMQLDLLEHALSRGTRICSLTSSPEYARTAALVASWCDSVSHNATRGAEQAHELRALWRGCGLVLDDRPWDVHYDMSKCTWKWVKHVFGRLGSTTTTTTTGGIGLHVRWGDMSLSSYHSTVDPLVPERSTPIDKAADLLRKLRSCDVRDELSVYMEWHNDTMLAGLGEPYRIVDSGDSIADLLDLAANRLMILDISSWTVLAHQIADGGVTVIPDHDLFDINWYDNGVNHVLRWNELLSIPCSDLSALLAL